MTTITDTTTAAPTLDTSKINSPAVVREHEQRLADFYAAKRAADKAKEKPAPVIHTMSQEDYYAQAVAVEEARKEKELARLVAELAAEKARADFLASSPAVVQLTESTAYGLLTNLQHWMHKGYTANVDNLRYFISGCYSVELLAPVAVKCVK
jgi:hypothetical protein